VPYAPPPSQQEFCPPALIDAAGPLGLVHRLLRGISDDHAGVARFCDSSPTAAVREAVGHFLEVYAGAAYQLSVTAGDLGYNLRLAAESYACTERQLQEAARAGGL
jgi:hypothetical protein